MRKFIIFGTFMALLPGHALADCDSSQTVTLIAPGEYMPEGLAETLTIIAHDDGCTLGIVLNDNEEILQLSNDSSCEN